MSMTLNKKFFMKIAKSILHIFIYILLGLALAFFINSTAQAAEPDDALRNQGRIEIITRAAGSGSPLSGGIFAIYRASDSRRVGELTTGAGGRAEFPAEPGIYFIRELRATFGFMLETERIFLEVGAGQTVVVELTKVRDLGINYAYLPQEAEQEVEQECDDAAFMYDIIHIVRRGDTLSHIARLHNTTWPLLAQYNALSNPHLIFPGQIIRIPNQTRSGG